MLTSAQNTPSPLNWRSSEEQFANLLSSLKRHHQFSGDEERKHQPIIGESAKKITAFTIEPSSILSPSKAPRNVEVTEFLVKATPKFDPTPDPAPRPERCIYLQQLKSGLHELKEGTNRKELWQKRKFWRIAFNPLHPLMNTAFVNPLAKAFQALIRAKKYNSKLPYLKDSSGGRILWSEVFRDIVICGDCHTLSFRVVISFNLRVLLDFLVAFMKEYAIDHITFPHYWSLIDRGHDGHENQERIKNDLCSKKESFLCELCQHRIDESEPMHHFCNSHCDHGIYRPKGKGGRSKIATPKISQLALMLERELRSLANSKH